MTTIELTTHDKLRQEAAELFARRGYSGTSMAEIASRVGIRKASLYNYYDSKADLMVELLERSLDAWGQACEVELPSEATVEARLAAYLVAAVEFGRDHSQAVGIIRLAAGQMPRDLRGRVQAILERHEQAWRETSVALFAEAIERGEVEAGDPDQLAAFWGVFVDGVLINQIFETARAGDMIARLQSLWELFWRGVGGRESSTELGL